MIVVMKRGVTEEAIQNMVSHVESLGLKPTVIQGTERTVVAVVGDERKAANIGALESDPGCRRSAQSARPLQTGEPGGEVGADRRDGRFADRGWRADWGDRWSLLGRGPGAAHGIRSGGSRTPAPRRCVAEHSSHAPAPTAFKVSKKRPSSCWRRPADETGLAIVTEVVSPEDVPLVAE